MGKQELALRITGKNSDGEYWLHIDGVPQKAGFNLGEPKGMIASALLMAASGHTYTRLDPNTRITALENFVAEVRDCVPDLFGADHDLIAVEVLEAFQADALELMPLDKVSGDPNTRVVTVEFLDRCRVYSTDDDTCSEIRAIIGEVK